MKIKSIILTIVTVILTLTQNLQAQCKVNNIFFESGEEMTYDLYAKLGPFHSKAGISTLTTSNDTYNNQKVYKVTLIAESTGTIRKFFALNDTLVSYMTKDIVPVAFKKDAHEASDETHEHITYTYKGDGSVNINAKRTKNGSERFDENITSTNCIYDMASIVMYARTLNYSSMKKGDEVTVESMSGRKKVKMVIEHDGKEKMKANDKKEYNCIKLILSISDDAFTNKEEAMRVYITDDKNRMPVRLDSQLKIGSTRAILKSYKGNKYPIGQQ